jgi:DNA-binding GntR family transcriptional regulator
VNEPIIDSATTKAASTESPSTLATAVYERLRRDILGGMLRPGQKLQVEFVRDRYRVGNSPVREALSRLSSDGLVERREQRGFYVAPISADDLRELALRESMAARTSEWEEGLVLALHRLSRVPRSLNSESYATNPEWERLHRAFHIALISNCGSRWLLAFCEGMIDQAYRHRQLAVAKIYPERNEAEEHRAIVQAAIEGDADAAVRELEAHYQRTAKIILECMDSAAPPQTLPRRGRAARKQPARLRGA